MDHYCDQQLSQSERLQTLPTLHESCERDILKWGNRKKWQRSLVVLQEMIDRNVPRSVGVYTAALRACSAHQGLAWEKSLHLFHEMQELKLQPDADTYSRAIETCTVTKRYLQGLQLMKQMRAAEVAPDEETYLSMLRCCARGGLWEQAIGLMAQRHDDGYLPKKEVYNVVIEACEEAEEYDWSGVVEDEAAALGFEITLAELFDEEQSLR